MEQSSVYDASTCENLIHALCATEKWRESFRLLDAVRVTANPSASAYCTIGARAFGDDQPTIGWKMLNECVSAEKTPRCDIFIAFIDWCGRQGNSVTLDELTKMLKFIGANDLVVSKRVVERLQRVYTNLGFSTQLMHVNKRY